MEFQNRFWYDKDKDFDQTHCQSYNIHIMLFDDCQSYNILIMLFDDSDCFIDLEYILRILNYFVGKKRIFKFLTVFLLKQCFVFTPLFLYFYFLYFLLSWF